MTKRHLTAFAGASLFVLAGAHTALAAQPAPAAPAAASAEEATLGEIVVTARRRSESLQEVPQTVNAVTSDTLQKLNITQFQDVQAVVPGLTLTPSVTGFQNSASLRGVNFDQTSGAQPSVAFYLNDAPVGLPFIYQSLFDVGQVEVLKGPQGTTRGVSAPSGAITVTTHKPSVSEFGGYADLTLTDLQGRNFQAAVNVPLIKDVLAARLAGVIDETSGNGVSSLHNSLRPRNKTDAFRASLSFEPNDYFNANVVYQHLDNQSINFTQVSGAGPGSFTLAGVTYPATVNPPLSPEDLTAVQDAPNRIRNHYDIVTAQFDSRFFGQHLSYIGSYQFENLKNEVEGGNPSAGDTGNLLPGVAILQNVQTQSRTTTHEIRLASDPAPGRFFDYTVGAYYSWTNVTGHIINPGTLLPGAFGATPTPNLAAYNPNYQIPVFIDIPSTSQETSLFGSVTLHLGDKTELSGGIRHIWSILNGTTGISLGNGLVSLPAIGLPASLPCGLLTAGFHFPVTNGAAAGDCVINSAGLISNFSNRSSESPNIYNVSLSHHFTRDFLVYVNTGTAFRPAYSSIGLQGQIANSSVPGVDTLTFHPAERSRSYEIGFKSTWLNGRARLNAAIFRQRFSNLTIYIPNIVYNNVLPGTPPSASFSPTNPAGSYVPTNFNLTDSVGALVQGFDVDAALQITPDWNVSVQGSYSDGKVQGSQVPCNITDANGHPVFNAGGLVSLCPGGSSSRAPFWSLTAQTEYVHPVRDNIDAFIRGLLNYYPENKNRAEPNFTVPAYSLVNLYLGVRSHDGAWEASIFARNAFGNRTATDISPVDAGEPLTNSLRSFPTLNHESGYFETIMTPRREVGVNMRYAWGSR